MSLKYNKWLDTITELPELDGGGKIFAPVFAELLKEYKVKTVYEWCSGPAWIGMWLLELGICEELVVSDINKKAIECVKDTAKYHSYNIRSYVSDNMKSIPEWERFDLVVANPPNYSNIQTSHPKGYLRYDLRPSDIDWKIHQNFYDTIGYYLKQDSQMFISEVDPYSTEVYFREGYKTTNKKLYDLRKNKPIDDFKKMISDNNLILEDLIVYNALLDNMSRMSTDVPLCMLKISKEGEQNGVTN